MTDTSYFHSRLKEWRKKNGLNQSQAAEICGIRQETWSRYENGALAPGMEVLAAIAAAGADVQYILTGIRSAGAVKEAANDYAALNRREQALLDNYRHIADEGDKRLVERTAQLAAVPAIKDETQSRKKKAG